MKKMLFFWVLWVVIFGICMAPNVVTAKWPTEPIIVVIPWPPANDPSTIIGNVMGPIMAKEFGVPVKIINKPGGAGVIGTDFVAKSKPDGHTVALSSIGPILTQPIRGVTPYKTEDFIPLGLPWASAFTLAARGNAPYNNLKELAEYAKKHDVKLGHWGLGAVPTLIAMDIAIKGGFKWKETAFSDLNALLLTSGDMDVLTISTIYIMDYVKTKQIKILAVMSPQRYEVCPEIPTVAEQGFGKGYFVWFGIFMPKGTPPEICKRFEEVWFKTMEDPEVIKVIKNTGVIPIKMRSEETKKQIADEREHFSKIMTELNLIKK